VFITKGYTMLIDELDTPQLVLDLDALRENLARYQCYYDEHGIKLRPHIKTHKTLAVAAMQMECGATGLTCQKVGEAEVMVAGGLDVDILITYNILGESKLDRLVALARQTNITVTADSAYVLQGYSVAAAGSGLTLGVLIEVDCGNQRTGVPTVDQAVELGRLAHALPGLELRGIMGYPTPPCVGPFLREVVDAYGQAGLPCPNVSGGSTKSAFQAHEIPELTEYRIGEYAVGGAGHLAAGRHTLEQCALRVIATVVSHPTQDRVILDSGSKTLSASTMETAHGVSMGYVVEYPEAHVFACSEEHAHVDVSRCERKPDIGERVQVLPVHPCPCVNLHDEMVAVRDGQVVGFWPVHARGKIR
jgi:D-serine deaminase-like pyridoxal phosphate-dependent protein